MKYFDLFCTGVSLLMAVSNVSDGLPSYATMGWLTAAALWASKYAAAGQRSPEEK